MKFIQIATAADAENGESLFALGDDGVIYERRNFQYSPGRIYRGRHIIRGRATTDAFWRAVDLPFTEPPLDELRLMMLELAEDNKGEAA